MAGGGFYTTGTRGNTDRAVLRSFPTFVATMATTKQTPNTNTHLVVVSLSNVVARRVQLPHKSVATIFASIFCAQAGQGVVVVVVVVVVAVVVVGVVVIRSRAGSPCHCRR